MSSCSHISAEALLQSAQQMAQQIEELHKLRRLAQLKQLASLTGNLGGEPAPKRESSQWQPIAKRL